MSFFPNALENLIDQFAALPGVGLSGLQATQTRVSDRFGRDIIAQVVAEKRMAEQPA